MSEYEDYARKRRIQNAFTAMGMVHYQADVRTVTQLTGDLYYVECEIAHVRVRCLAMDTGAEAIVFLEASAAHEIFTRPALERYTVEHPWLLGV